MEALHGFDEGGLDNMDSYLGSDEEGLCGSGRYGGMAGLASLNALGLDDMRDDVGLLDGKRGKVSAARLSSRSASAGCGAACADFSQGSVACPTAQLAQHCSTESYMASQHPGSTCVLLHCRCQPRDSQHLLRRGSAATRGPRSRSATPAR